MPYEKRLVLFGLESMKRRREVLDLCTVYRIIHGHIELPTNEMFRFGSQRTRGNPHKLLMQRVNSERFRRFFTNRVILAWNQLPAEIVLSETPHAFTSRLTRHLLGREDPSMMNIQ